MSRPAVPNSTLGDFAATRSEAAFAEVVNEFGGLVFSSALRRTGEPELAEEITQSVFAILAHKAAAASRHPSLSGWHFTVTNLAFLEEVGMDFRMAGDVVMASANDPALREEIWKALDGEMDPEIREGLNSTLVVTIYQESGLSGVEETMKRLKFDSSKERDQALLNVASLSMMTAPAETMTWIDREFSPETQIQAIPNALRSWAERDFEAAGNWLKTQEPSQVKNEAISGYATTVAKLDPAAALEWSEKITEAESRDDTRRQVLDDWHEADPDAASAWVEGQGWNAEEWLPK